MLDIIIDYAIAALIIWRFAGGTILEIGAAIAICWGIMYWLQTMAP